MKNKWVRMPFLLFFLLLLSGCGNNDFIPKPRGYFRISLPEKKYVLLDSIYPFSFEYPVYSEIKQNLSNHAEPFWMNIEFSQFKGTLHLSYKKVTSDSLLYQYFEDSRSFVNKHIAKADDIEPLIISNDSSSVYGIIYDIVGTGVASTYQFCVTDSTKHFLRGALYFKVLPNNDSLSPVISFIKTDIDHLIKTLHWKNTDQSARKR